MTDLSLSSTQELADELIKRCDGIVLGYIPKTNDTAKGFVTYVDGDTLPASIGLLHLLNDRMNMIQHHIWEEIEED